jgi:hypothetical protein
MEPATPYLSVVAASRNDDHGGSLLRRMQAFFDNFLGQCRRHRLDAELLLVEWNPPADRPRLADALHWPADLRPCAVRIIEVPNEVHRRFAHADQLSLFQMIAKNVGIRRARGRFILAANIDLLFSDELMAFLAARRLEPGRMYRIDRLDVTADVPTGGIDEQLDYCRSHLLRINRREGTFPLTPDGQPTLFPEDIVPAGQGLLPGTGWYPVEWQNGERFRWAADAAAISIAEARAADLALEIEPGPGVGYRPFELQARDPEGTLLASRRIDGRCRIVVPVGTTHKRLLLHAPDGNRPTPNDPRILNFRVFQLNWQQTDQPSLPMANGSLAAEDIAAAEVGVRFGAGWYDVEQGRGGRYRWAGQDAQLVVQLPEGEARPLTLPVEPGPGVAERPFVLEVRDEMGQVVYRQRVDGWRPLTLRLPGQPGTVRRLTLHVRQGGRLSDDDGRLLNFRVFGPVCWGRRLLPSARQLWCLAAGLGGRGSRRAVESRAVPARQEPRPPLESKASLVRRGSGKERIISPAPLHLGTAGDFTLMACEHWFAVRGYPEFAVFPLHVDTLLCYQAHHAGARETVLSEPLRLYHIEHGSGTAWTGAGTPPILQRLESEGIPFLGAGQVLRWGTEMRRRGQPLLFNPPDWGLGEQKFADRELACAPMAHHGHV